MTLEAQMGLWSAPKVLLPPLDSSLGDAKVNAVRSILSRHARAGSRCPCCEGYVKEYKRRLTPSMAISLATLYRVHQRLGSWSAWVHLQQEFARLRPEPRLARALRGGMASMLRFWRLIEAKAPVPGDADESRGLFRITESGIAFVEGRATVPQFVYLYLNEFRGADGPAIDFRGALAGGKFTVEEVLR